MATLPESAIFEEGIFQLEKSTPALGGAPVFSGPNPTTGHANAQAAQLANRTQWLKTKVDSQEQKKVNSSDLADREDTAKGSALWGYKGRNGYERLGDLVSVRDYISSAVDGTTSNQEGVVAAVADAIAKNADLLWPAGTYVRTGSIPGFHQVRHVGPGVIKSGAITFVIQPKGKATTRNTFYVSSSGDDINDGLSSTTPFKTIQKAFDALSDFGPYLSGLWDISIEGVVVGAGSISGVLSRDFITVKGTSTSGQPTSEVDVTGLNSPYGMNFSGGMRVQTRDILVRGARNGTGLASGIVLDAGTTGYHVNTWTRDCEQNGINANIRCRLLVQGGDFQADDTGLRVYGESSAFIGYNSVRVAIRDADAGVAVSGSSYSHTDYIDFIDCDYGITCEYQSHSTNYNNTFSGVKVGWEARTGSTINTLNPTVTGSFSTARSRSSFSMMGADNGNNNYNYTMQFHPSLGANGRLGFGYTTWVPPFVDFQYSKGGTTAGYSLSAFGSCTALWESNANTILGLAAPDASFSSIWFGDSTSARRSEIRASSGSLYVVQNNVTKWAFRTNDFVPFADSVYAVGSASLRPSVIYSATATINTSDENLKTDIRTIELGLLRAWAKVDYVQYKFEDAVERKGDGARWHFGLVAQRVKAAFESEGLDAFEYGLLCYDEWEAVDETTSTRKLGTLYDPIHGNREGVEEPSEGSSARWVFTHEEVTVVSPAITAGQRYGIRYEEALVLEAALARHQREVESAKTHTLIENLQAKLVQLEGRINASN